MKTKAHLKPKTQSVRRRILVPIGSLLIGMLVLLCLFLFGSGLLKQLNTIAITGLEGRVINRADHLQAQMTERWSELGYTAKSINALYDSLAISPDFTSSALESNAGLYSPFLKDTAEHLIDLMRNADVTGAFVVLNAERYSSAPLQKDSTRPCLYLSDRDPISPYTDDNTDLLLKYAPLATARELAIACDSTWMPLYPVYAGSSYPDYWAEPFNAALENPALPANACGYWSGPHNISGADDPVISYSMPLISSEGTVYGTLGIELSMHFLQSQLPPLELGESANGLYYLYTQPAGDAAAAHSPVLTCGPAYGNTLDNVDAVFIDSSGKNSSRLSNDPNLLFLCQHPLSIYGADSPFLDTQWILAGGLPGYALFSITNTTLITLILVVVLISLFCLLGILLITRLITTPVEQLSREVQASSTSQPLALHKTGIMEIDMLADSIEGMSRELHQFANKFSEILSMASTNIGGFEYKRAENTLFINDNFFGVFGSLKLQSANMTPEQFETAFNTFLPFHVSHRTVEGTDMQEDLFCVPQQGAAALWARLRYFWRDDQCVGLLEDVTAERREMDKIAYERDHDVLTGSLNRRAWSRRVNALFAETHVLQNAVLLMIDLDNLKFVNDTYGHDAGDAYICAAADALRNGLPNDSVLCRKSGDEFLALIYGYEDTQALRELIAGVRKQFRGSKIPLKNGRYYPLRASGGTAWYPTDTTDLGNLIRYADFAMYKAKSNIKGEICDFEASSYQRESYILQGQQALDEMIEHSLVDYYFQPIVDAHTGDVFAYEALMRPRVDGLRSPSDVVTLARREGKLEGIERLTWFCAMDAFVQHSRQGFVSDTCRVFINSVPSRIMSEEDISIFSDRFRGYLHRIVQEQTEEERPDSLFQRRKLEILKSWGACTALDDYGSGYNSEKTLLLYHPEFVKLDIALVSGIEKNMSQQQIVENIVLYATRNNIRIIAEGVETQEEAAKLISLGVHYLQGYYLARPALIPPLIPAEVIATISRMNALQPRFASE